MSDEMKYDYGTSEETSSTAGTSDYGGPVEYGYGNSQQNASAQNSYETMDYGTGNPYQEGSDQHAASHYSDPYRDGVQEEPAGFAIASLVLGIISLVISCLGVNIVTGILAIIFGAIHLARRRSRRGVAIAGLVLGILSIAIFLILLAIGISVIGNAMADPGAYPGYSDILDMM